MKEWTIKNYGILGGATASLAAVALYLSTIAPSLTWGWRGWGADGGDLLAAAYTLGIPHPSGYPTYTLLLKVFGTLVPIGDFAFRGNLFSALCMAGAVGAVYWFSFRMIGRLWPGQSSLIAALASAAGGLTFATGPLVWSQAIITEVYALNALFVGLFLIVASYLTEKPSDPGNVVRARTRGWIILGLLTGLGVGNHLTLLSIAGPGLIWVLMDRRPSWRLVSLTFIAGAVGLLIYLYIPIRAAANPPVNWISAASPGGFYELVSGEIYRAYVFAVPYESLGQRFTGWINLVFEQLNPLGITLAVIGTVALFRRSRTMLFATGASAVVILVYGLTYNTFDFQVLMVPTFLIYGSYVAFGTAAAFDSAQSWARESLARSTQEGRIPQRNSIESRFVLAVAVVVLIGVPGASVFLNYEGQNLSDDSAAIGAARNVLDNLPNRALVLADSETALFPLWYMLFVENTDREVAPISSRLLQFDWYRENIEDRYGERLPAHISDDPKDAIIEIVTHAQGREPVYFTFNFEVLNEALNVEPAGAGLYQARPK